MTNEQLRQNAAAMLALADGNPVQWRPFGQDQWRDLACEEGAMWNLYLYEYRPKPQPITRPWSKPEDVPGPVCWIRYSFSAEVMISAVERDGVWYSGLPENKQCTWKELHGYEYSTDRKTWGKCEVVSE